MKTHLISNSDGAWEEVNQFTYDGYIHHTLSEMVVLFGIKATRCIRLLEEYAVKFASSKFTESNRQKLNDINLFLRQCNEAYVLRKYHLAEEMQYIENRYKKE